MEIPILIARIATGYAVSLVLGHIATARCTGWLWDRVPSRSEDGSLRPPSTIRVCQGIAERFVYTSTICLGRPEGIAVFLAFKAVMRWKIGENDPRHTSGSAIYIVGTVLSLTFGVIGGLIVTWSRSM